MEQHTVVLMSTYNGQQYLAEQLDSIMEQTYRGQITVLIRDDGSRDVTQEIAMRYPQDGDSKVVFTQAKNVGPQRSFLELIRTAPKADYYFFADQDDVWDADKFAVATEAMAQYDEPVCWCSNFRHSHMDLTIYEEKALAKPPVFTPLQIIFYNQIPGCVMGFNGKLMELLQQLELEDCMMHDSLALALAAACGRRRSLSGWKISPSWPRRSIRKTRSPPPITSSKMRWMSQMRKRVSRKTTAPSTRKTTRTRSSKESNSVKESVL